MNVKRHGQHACFYKPSVNSSFKPTLTRTLPTQPAPSVTYKKSHNPTACKERAALDIAQAMALYKF